MKSQLSFEFKPSTEVKPPAADQAADASPAAAESQEPKAKSRAKVLDFVARERGVQ